MTGWEGWKLPANWREILDDTIDKFDRHISRLEESDETEQTKELVRQMADSEIQVYPKKRY